MLPEEDSALAGHVSHAAVPTTLLNVPASHALHGLKIPETPVTQLAVKPPSKASAAE
jgi:hypothetical protein